MMVFTEIWNCFQH